MPTILNITVAFIFIFSNLFAQNDTTLVLLNKVDSTFTLEGLEFRIGRIEKVEGVGYKVIRKIS